MKRNTNIQELYENLVDNHKKLILFGVGQYAKYCISQINSFLHIVCDNWDTPHYLDNSGRYLYRFDNIVNHIEFAVDNNDEKVKTGYCVLEGKQIKICSVKALEGINKEKYIILITTELYEEEIKCQLSKMDGMKNIEYYGFASDLHHYKKKNRGLMAERVIVPYMELIKQPYYQKNRELSDRDEYNRLLSYISAGKYVNNIIGFEITTVCNLSCENCGDYIPRLKRHEHIPVETVIQDIDTFFEVADLVYCVTLVSGEVLFHPGIKQILNKLLSIDKVERIDLVTNGIKYPEDKELLRILANKKIMLHMSNYDMSEKTDISRKVYIENGVDIRFMGEQMSWRKVNPKPYNKELDNEKLENIYLKCGIARCCPQIIRKGKIYSCGRVIRLKQISAFDSEHDYCNVQRESQNIKEMLLNLKLEPYMDACNWCDWSEVSSSVKPGEQHKDKLNLGE